MAGIIFRNYKLPGIRLFAVQRINDINVHFYQIPRRLLSLSGVHHSISKYFTDKHEWISVDQKTATVGISDYAQKALGDVVYVQLPEVGAQVRASEECGALESVKAASELYSPVSGKVIQINGELEAKPELVNKSCYEEGWLFKLELKDTKEIEGLMTEEVYEQFLKSDSSS